MVKYVLGLALLASGTTLQAADPARTQQCATHYMTMTHLLDMMAAPETPSKEELKPAFKEMSGQYGQRVLKLLNVTTMEQVPAAIRDKGLADHKQLFENPRESIDVLRKNVAACDKEFSFEPIMPV